MNRSLIRFSKFKHYTHVVLVMFVVSVLNMSFQVPVHAAMQQAMSNSVNHMTMDHSAMGHDISDMDMSQMSDSECCPPSLCESVDAQQDQLAASSVSIQLFDFNQTIPSLVFIQKDQVADLSHLNFIHSNRLYHQNSPPPIKLTTELQI